MAIDDRSPQLVGVATALLFLAVLTSALRVYVRIVMIKAFRVEDWLSIVTLVSFTLLVTCIYISVHNGGGKHVDDITIDGYMRTVRARFFGELAYIITSLFLKLTVGLLLLRVSSRPWQKWTIYTVLGAMCVFSTCFFFVAIFQCSPVSYYWLKINHEISGQCKDASLSEAVTYAATAVSAWSDWTLGLLPITIVWNLKIGIRTKLSIIGILAFGILASTATLVRIRYIPLLTQGTDTTYDFVDFVIWSLVEVGVGLVASSVATLRPLFKRFLGRSRNESYPLGPSGGKVSAGANAPGSKVPQNVGSWKDDRSPPRVYIRGEESESTVELGLIRPKDVNDGRAEWEKPSKFRPASAYSVLNP